MTSERTHMVHQDREIESERRGKEGGDGVKKGASERPSEIARWRRRSVGEGTAVACRSAELEL